MVSPASRSPSGHVAARTPAATAATAVVRRQAAPGGVDCQQRARRLALSACSPMPGLLTASRGRASAAARPRRPRRVARAAAAAETAAKNTRRLRGVRRRRTERRREARSGNGEEEGVRRVHECARHVAWPGNRTALSGQQTMLPTNPRGPIRL